MTKLHFEKEIFNWLNKKEIRPLLETKGNLTNIAFHHLIRWHPQISDDGYDTYNLNFIDKIRNWEISMRGIIAFEKKLNHSDRLSSISLINKVLIESTHPEHNVSVDSKKQQLLKLENYNLKTVQDCLNEEYKVILLSKEESNVLNGSVNKEYKLDGKNIRGIGLRTIGSYTERLNAIGASIATKQEKEALIRFLINRFL